MLLGSVIGPLVHLATARGDFQVLQVHFITAKAQLLALWFLVWAVTEPGHDVICAALLMRL